MQFGATKYRHFIPGTFRAVPKHTSETEAHHL